MNIVSCKAVYFSPTDSTKRIVKRITECMPYPTTADIDLTPFASRSRTHIFGPEELVVFGVPVYGGRVPAPAVERLKNLQGDHSPAVLVAVYGNRDYDDALLEMQELVKRNDFVPVAATALIAEHSIMRSVAQGRPDEKDLAFIENFVQNLAKKLSLADRLSALAPLQVKGNTPYREYSGVPFKPSATKACTGCGICAAQCPVHAIPAEHPEQLDKSTCISCMRCIKVCPENARRLNKIMLSSAEKVFAHKCAVRREPELFL